MKKLFNKKNEISQIIDNKDVLQSYIITVAKYNFTIYEKRILYRIVEMLQSSLEGKKLDKFFKIEEYGIMGKLLSLPISAILSSRRDDNYTQIKKAFRSLKKKEIIYEDDKVWSSISLIRDPEIMKYKRCVVFSLHPRIYEALLNFSKGFRKYELETAISLKSVYSMRFYEMFSGQKQVITYSIEELKNMFKVENKYKKTTDFIKRIIIPAKKELDKSASYSFTFCVMKIKKNKITAITFTPIYSSKNRDETLETKTLQRNVDIYWSISEKSKIILQDEYNFTTPELKRHAKLWERVEKELNLPMELAKIKEKALKAINPKGYIIASLKNMIKVSENTNNFITPKFVKKQTRKTKKINSNSIVDVEPILEMGNEVYASNKSENISTIKYTNTHTVSSINEKTNSSAIVEITSEITGETSKKLINHINSLNEKIMAIEQQIDRKNHIEIITEGKANEVLNKTIVEINKVDNEQPKTKTLDTQTKNNIYDNKPAFSFLQNISKWIIGQFKRK